MDTKEIYEELRDMEGRLRKMCHHPQCEKPRECPRKHMECTELLGLNTAIAWMTADIINDIITYADTEAKYSIADALIRISVLERVVTIDDEHPDLLIHLGMVINLLRNMSCHMGAQDLI